MYTTELVDRLLLFSMYTGKSFASQSAVSFQSSWSTQTHYNEEYYSVYRINTVYPLQLSEVGLTYSSQIHHDKIRRYSSRRFAGIAVRSTLSCRKYNQLRIRGRREDKSEGAKDLEKFVIKKLNRDKRKRHSCVRR